MIDPRSRTRNRQVVRVLRIVALLQGGWWTARGLARKLDASTRTIRRDLAAIRHGRVRLRSDGTDQAWTLAK